MKKAVRGLKTKDGLPRQSYSRKSTTFQRSFGFSSRQQLQLSKHSLSSGLISQRLDSSRDLCWLVLLLTYDIQATLHIMQLCGEKGRKKTSSSKRIKKVQTGRNRTRQVFRQVDRCASHYITIHTPLEIYKFPLLAFLFHYKLQLGAIYQLINDYCNTVLTKNKTRNRLVQPIGRLEKFYF